MQAGVSETEPERDAPAPTRAAAPAVRPEAPAHRDVLALQCAAGNRATARLLGRQVAAVEPEIDQRAEAAFGATPGRVERVGIRGDRPEDNDEFILWNFRVGDERIRDEHKVALRPVAKRWVKEFAAEPNLRVRLSGFASRSGTSSVNDDLAQRRVESVRDFLVAAGVPKDRIVVDAGGSRHPLAKGTSPSDLARNRRVEVSKFFKTEVVSTLGAGLQVKATDLRFTPGAEVFEASDAQMFAMIAKASLTETTATVTSNDPAIQVGWLQFLVADVRRGTYVDASQRRADLDFSHCMGDFVPCRDVEFARLPFSFEEPTTPLSENRHRVAKPGGGPTKLVFNDRPGVGLPWSTSVAGRGAASLESGAWGMTFVVVLVARKGSQVLPLHHLTWAVEATMTLDRPGRKGARIKHAIRERSRGKGPPPNLDIDRAMSFPSCRLRARTLDLPGHPGVCRPELTVRS